MSARGTTNRNARGSASARRTRRQYLLDTFGDGTSCPCHYCGCTLTVETLTVDRIVPGILGGTYRRDNIRPACMHDNSIEGTALRERIKHGLEGALA